MIILAICFVFVVNFLMEAMLWKLINRAAQTQKMVRGLKFFILKEEGLYYLCSKNKGADQLCSYFTADLLLCFCICKKQVFS